MKKMYYIGGFAILLIGLLLAVWLREPTEQLSNQLTTQPTAHPTEQPTTLPTIHPTVQVTTETTVQTEKPTELNPYKETVSVNQAWGEEKPENFGLQKGEEVESIGPHTFALNRNGKIYVLDNIRSQVKMFDDAGGYQQSLSFNGWGADIAIGDQGEVFSLEADRLIVSFPNGETAEQALSTDIPAHEGYGEGMRFDDAGNLYVCKLQQCYQVGAVVDGKMIFLNSEEQQSKIISGYPIQGNKYLRTEWISNHDAVVKIMNGEGAVIQQMPLTTPDIFGAVLFRQQDQTGNIYVEVERISSDDYVHLEIWKFDEAGTLVSVTELPNDYYTTVYKKTEVDQQGIIHQVITTPEGVKLLTWKPR